MSSAISQSNFNSSNSAKSVKIAPLKYIPEDSRLTFLPIPSSRLHLHEHYKAQLETRWRAEEIDFTQDKVDYETKLTPAMRTLVDNSLALFSQLDEVVNRHISNNLEREVRIPEFKYNFHEQMAMEDIHAHTYALQLYNIIDDSVHRASLMDSIHNMPAINSLYQWSIQWMNEEANFAQKIVGGACIEGLFFVSVFCAIFWLKSRGLTPGLCQANELISKDENNHVTTLVLLYELIEDDKKLTNAQFHEIIRDAVVVGTEYVKSALPINLENMNVSLMTTYLQYTADMLAVRFGYSKIYSVSQPFEFMNKINYLNKVNFFEKKNTEYEKKLNTVVINDCDDLDAYEI